MTRHAPGASLCALDRLIATSQPQGALPGPYGARVRVIYRDGGVAYFAVLPKKGQAYPREVERVQIIDPLTLRIKRTIRFE